jgi:hypothetical protein
MHDCSVSFRLLSLHATETNYFLSLTSLVISSRSRDKRPLSLSLCAHETSDLSRYLFALPRQAISDLSRYLFELPRLITSYLSRYRCALPGQATSLVISSPSRDKLLLTSYLLPLSLSLRAPETSYFLPLSSLIISSPPAPSAPP